MKRVIWSLAAAAVMALGFMGEAVGSEVVKVSSLDELLPYLKRDSVRVELEKGVYRVTTEDMTAGRFPALAEVVEGRKTHALFLVEGDGCVIDFGGSTVEFETAAFDVCNYEMHQLHLLGSGNVVKNLKLVDVGDVGDFPKNGCTNIVLDGANNRIEEVELRSVGSFPYGYGELFGKGGQNTIRHRKHCGVLVRGESNHVLNCVIVHHAYGHCLFMQAANNPIIEGCYIEAQMRTTDDMLLEAGTGTPADKIDFKTAFTGNYRVPAGYKLALSEEGIRAYNGGNTMINGERFKRGASNVTVKDCYVKSARAGVTLTHARGFKYVENCTAIGCERAFAVGMGGKIVNCYADAQHGPVFGVDYESDRGIEVDITLLPYQGESYNGSRHAAIIIGHNHNITLRKGSGLGMVDEQLLINIGGDNHTIGELGKISTHKASGIVINNDTTYPIVLDAQASNITGSTRGEIIDNGENNSIKIK